METWTAIKAKSGQTLTFDYLRTGARAYIAFAGGIDTPTALGSRSTYSIGALGGVDGRAVQPDDTLPLGTSGQSVTEGAGVPANLRRDPKEQHSQNLARPVAGRNTASGDLCPER